MLEILVFLTINDFVLIISETKGDLYAKDHLAAFTKNELKTFPPNIIKDAFLNVPQLIEHYGFPLETHEIETEDGYLLTMHRIPGQRVNSKGAGVGIPVLMIHGIHGSSNDWILNGPKKSLGYILADRGYDIWMGNCRGNHYSRKHIFLDPDKGSRFWQFSWHEIGYYDLPALIDHVLKITDRKKLHLIVHSQGTAVFLVMASMKPKYNEKIILSQALAPITFLSNARSPVLKLLAPLFFIFEKVAPALGIYEFRTTKEIMRFLIHECSNETSILYPICLGIVSLTIGHDPNQLNVTMIPVYFSRYPAGAGNSQLYHFFQIFTSGKFRQYDYGKMKNKQLYGKFSPPDYNLTKVTAPVILHYAKNDLFTSSKDIDLLCGKLPNVINKYEVPYEKFNHIDFIIAIDAYTLLYDLITNILLKY